MLGQRSCGLEEDHVSRGVVEHRGEAAGGPKIVPRLRKPKVRPLHVENLQRRLHADEDAEEQDGHLDDGGVAEAVRPPCMAGRPAPATAPPAPIAPPPGDTATDANSCRAAACRGPTGRSKAPRRPAARRSATSRRNATDARESRPAQYRPAVRADSTNSGPRESRSPAARR